MIVSLALYSSIPLFRISSSLHSPGFLIYETYKCRIVDSSPKDGQKGTFAAHRTTTKLYVR